MLGDYSDEGANLYIDKLVTSGSCFINLANEIEESLQLVAADPEAARSRLKKTSRTLLYLQSRYKIASRSTLDYKR